MLRHLAIIALLFPFAAAAQAPANTISKNHLSFSGGFTRGGMALAADYERSTHRTYGIGGYVHLYPEDAEAGGAAIQAIGGFIRPHFTRQSWDFYLSAGFGFAKYKLGSTDETMIGPSLGLGLLYQLSRASAIGIEQMSFYGWLGEDNLRGGLAETLLARFRYSF